MFFRLIFIFIIFSSYTAKTQAPILIDYLFTIGASGDSTGMFQRPQALSVDPSGYLYIADTGNHRIQRFDQNGKFINYIGGLGIGQKQFDMPTDVCARDGLNIFVTDFNNHRIQQLDRRLNLAFVFSNGSVQQQEYHFLFPKSLVVTSQGDLFLIENEQNSVLKFNSFFNPIIRFGAIESGEGGLNNPQQIETDGNQYIFISDSQTGRVAVFDYFGNFIQFWGEKILKEPVGLFYFTATNHLLVSDIGSKKIYALMQMNATEIIPLQKERRHRWDSPVDIARHDNRLYVLDQHKNCILAYRIVPDAQK